MHQGPDEKHIIRKSGIIADSKERPESRRVVSNPIDAISVPFSVLQGANGPFIVSLPTFFFYASTTTCKSAACLVLTY